MLVKSLNHAMKHDPDGATAAGILLASAPIRFGLDLVLLGPIQFAVAVAIASTYIVNTFVATHQIVANHHETSESFSQKNPNCMFLVCSTK